MRTQDMPLEVTKSSEVRERPNSDSAPPPVRMPCIENLTERIRRSGPLSPSPFDDDPVYNAFFDTLCRALHRSAPRHVMVVAERGTAEHAVLLELSRRGLEGRPPFLRGKQFILLTCRHVPIEQMSGFIDASLAGPDATAETVVILDGWANILRCCGSSEMVRSAVLTSLITARCRVIGILTPRDYESYCAGDAELGDLFSGVDLPEPQPDVARRLVRHFAAGLEASYRVHIQAQAIDRVVVLSDHYILHERLPYKAVKVLQHACDDLEYDRSQAGASRAVITEADVLENISQISGVPIATLAGMGEQVDYRRSLSEVIVGQEHAVAEVATELGLIKAGMVDSDKPASVMMFVGQTGTGKTEMAKALARLYSSSKRLKTFTLGNFSEPHSVSGIIGVPAGYVGHEQGGRLVNEINADPYGVFLLDEADKAHPDVMQPFLNLFDEGWIADQKGNRAYAQRAIFILTTNVGQRQIADMCKSGKNAEEIASSVKDLLSRIRHTKSNRPVFSPEFMARVKRFVVFRTLDQPAMVDICRRAAENMRNQWQRKRQKILTIPDDLITAIGRQAFAIDAKSQGKEGGRIVRKLIADFVESKVQRAISQDPQTYRTCGTVEIGYAPAVGTGNAGLLGDGISVRFHESRPNPTVTATP